MKIESEDGHVSKKYVPENNRGFKTTRRLDVFFLPIVFLECLCTGEWKIQQPDSNLCDNWMLYVSTLFFSFLSVSVTLSAGCPASTSLPWANLLSEDRRLGFKTV